MPASGQAEVLPDHALPISLQAFLWNSHCPPPPDPSVSDSTVCCLSGGSGGRGEGLKDSEELRRPGVWWELPGGP